MVHQAVHPVKIAVVHKKHERKGKKEIKPPVISNIPVESCVRRDPGVFQKKQGNQGEDGHRENGKTYFPGVIFPMRVAGLNFFIGNIFSKQDIKKDKGKARYHKISVCGLLKYAQVVRPMH